MPQDPDLVTLDAVRAAASRIAPFVHETPIVPLTPTGVGLKAESLHPIGAFKIRGAFNALLGLDETERRRGVIAHSAEIDGHIRGLAQNWDFDRVAKIDLALRK